MRVRDLREATGFEKIQTLLRNNYYGWFEKVDRGIYRLSAEGKEALNTYGEVVRKLR